MFVWLTFLLVLCILFIYVACFVTVEKWVPYLLYNTMWHKIYELQAICYTHLYSSVLQFAYTAGLHLMFNFMITGHCY